MKTSLLIALTILSNFSAANDDLKPKPKNFLSQFTQLMHQPNAKLAALYSETALIQRTTADSERHKISGKQYKLWLNTTPARDLQQLDSDFSNVDFYTNGSRIAIKATRYLKSFCFSDTEYFIVIDKDSEGNYRIVKEHMQQPDQSQCKSALNSNKPLKVSFNQAAEKFAKIQPYNVKQEIDNLASKLNGKLPLSVDKNIQLTHLSVTDTSLHYHYTMLQYSSNPNYNSILAEVITPNAVRQFCTEPAQQKIILNGGSSLHSYHDKDGTDLFSFEVSAKQCGKYI